LVLCVGACGAPAEDGWESDPSLGSADDENVDQITQGACSAAQAEKVLRFPDTEEGAQWGGELAYWCSVGPNFSVKDIMISHANWMSGSSSQQNLTRRNMILRNYKKSWGRTGNIVVALSTSTSASSTTGITTCVITQQKPGR
jgi:hypothetical protein